MQYPSAARRTLTPIWLSLLAYSALFGLLQKVVLPPLHLPVGVVLLVSSLVAAAAPLCCGALLPRQPAALQVRAPRPGTVAFLFCVSMAGNLVVMALTPVLEQLWKLAGLTAQQPAGGDETLPPLVALYICLVGPVLEELIYRGVLLRRLQPYGGRVAVVLSALCFGLMHHDLYQGLSAFWGGLVFGYAAWQYSLGLAIGLHIAGNTVAVVLPLLRSAGTPGALAMLALLVLPGVVAAVGGIRLALHRRAGPPRVAAPAAAVWADPALWALLLFDTVYLAALSFARLPAPPA